MNKMNKEGSAHSMKRIACFILMIILFVPYAAMAEVDFDASGYSLEDLITIRASVEEEINNRVGSATATLQPGTYVAGVDIVAGSYVLVGLMDEGPTGYTPEAYYFESMDKYHDRDYIDQHYLKEGQDWRITLQDGMVLYISAGDCTIQQAAPLLFAPN